MKTKDIKEKIKSIRSGIRLVLRNPKIKQSNKIYNRKKQKKLY
jgi:hypothetical protein